MTSYFSDLIIACFSSLIGVAKTLPSAAQMQHEPSLESEVQWIILSAGGLQSVGAMEPSIWKSTAVWAIYG